MNGGIYRDFVYPYCIEVFLRLQTLLSPSILPVYIYLPAALKHNRFVSYILSFLILERSQYGTSSHFKLMMQAQIQIAWGDPAQSLKMRGWASCKDTFFVSPAAVIQKPFLPSSCSTLSLGFKAHWHVLALVSLFVSRLFAVTHGL